MNAYCEVCEITFSTNKALSRHFLTQRHAVRENIQLEYVCTCKRSFSSQSALYRHRKKCEPYQSAPNSIVSRKPNDPSNVVNQYSV